MKTNFAIMLFLSFSFANINFSYNGEFTQFYSQRKSNNEVLNIPFRILNLNTTFHFGNNFEVKSLISLQYHNTRDDYFDTKNISDEIRELYGTYYFNLGEISFGKKLFTLGSVDENSPIDHFNPYNYYYLLIGGTDKKIGVNSLSFDFYFNNFTLRGAVSPNHNLNYYPNNDSEYSLSLPISPEQYLFLDNKGSEHESFLSFQTNINNNTEITLTHLRAFDRVFSLSGFTMHEFTGPYIEVLDNFVLPDGNGETQNPGTWFSYRLTESLSLGFVKLFEDFIIRADVAHFHSFDRYEIEDYQNFRSLQDYEYSELDPNHSDIYNVFNDQYNIDGECSGDNLQGCNDLFIAPLNENVKYSQLTFQIELPLPNDWQFNMQFFKYDLLRYDITNYTFEDVVVNLPLVTIDLNEVINDDGDFFNPGFGSSMSSLSQKSILLGIDKKLFDNNLQASITSFFDLDKGNGKLISFELDYQINDSMNFIFGGTTIFNDESVISTSFIDPGYIFNIMEDFSHNRIQFNYYF